jgi:hypothetical protein
MDSCAIGKDGKLLDATSIQWYNDADDGNPLPPASSEVSRSGMYTNRASDIIYFHKNDILGTPVDTDGFQPVLGRGRRVKNTGAMSSAIKKLGEDDDGQPMQATRPRKRTTKRVSTPNKYSTLDIEETSEDSDFSDEVPGLQSCSDSDSDSGRDEQMTNEEVFRNIYASSINTYTVLFLARRRLTTKDSS